MLRVVADQPGISPNAIATQLRLARPTVSNSMQALRHAGLIAVRHSDADSRRVHVSLTEKAEHLLGRYDAVSEEILTAALDKLTATERDVVARCRRVGGEATAVRADVTDIGDVRCLADVALAELGSIDVWVSNVGVGAIGRYQDTPIEAHEKVIRTNLIGHMNDAHVVLPIFLEQHRGTFINMISLGAFAAAPYAVAYR